MKLKLEVFAGELDYLGKLGILEVKREIYKELGLRVAYTLCCYS